MPQSVTSLYFPKFRRVSLKGFTLYANNPNPSLAPIDGTTCIVGANGLGKSTFLAAATFALTGHLPDPDREFQSLAKFVKDSSKFPLEYFSGRIEESDRAGASVSLEMDVHGKRYLLERSVFNPATLLQLSILESGKKAANDIASAHLPEDRNDFYRKQLVRDIGLNSFEQLIFLHHEVFTFDERRILLFWDERLMEQTLYLAFGLDPALADKATWLRKEAERQGSLGRNANWQATQTRSLLNRLENDLKGLVNTNVDDQTFAEYELLFETQDDIRSQAVKLDSHIRDQQAAIANLAAKQLDLKDAYEKEFSTIFDRKDVWKHPVVAHLLHHGECLACGTIGEDLKNAAVEARDKHRCPVCGSSVSSKEPSEDVLTALTRIDAEVGEASRGIREARLVMDRLSDEKRGLDVQLSELLARQRIIEAENVGIANKDRLDVEYQAMQRRYAGLETTLEELVQKRNDHYGARDDCMAELEQLQTALVGAFRKTEDRFIPSFKTLAESFIGRNVSARLELRAQNRCVIVLDLDGGARREDFQLSESQKYFLDIALRMALILNMASPESRPCFFVDTPEGSLDIAYESRAGHMFSEFSKKCDVLMTANLNSSHLLLKLAAECRTQGLRLEKMTEWAALSEVQQSESHLFKLAYEHIEKAMLTGKIE